MSSAAKFDMLRINQLTNSPITSPVQQARLRPGATGVEENKMIMRTPVMNGKTQSVESKRASDYLLDSPAQSKPFQSPAMAQRSVLAQYAKKSNYNPQEEHKEEKKQQQQTQVKNVKSSLSKNL